MQNDVIQKNELNNGILHLTLNRPEQLNALSQEVLTTLSRMLKEAKADDNVKALLISGNGKAFCAGADIKQLASLTAPEGLRFARFGQDVFRQLELLGKPSLAAIHGYAFGGGLELAMATTIRIAQENTQFGQPEIKLGVIPGFGGTQRLSRLIGKGRALSLCLTGNRFKAEEALHWGLVTDVTPQDELLPRAIEILASLADLPPFALQAIMTSIDQGYNLSLEEALQIEAAQFGLCCATKDKQEGVNAFIEKRKAHFSGQ